jgi:D-beta-D-heptose 7-phosphate kinase/D-beta-D-heptose 1-phosphate adenosyltransferase
MSLEPAAVVVISGYANPIHAGHVEYARQAHELAGPTGTVVFIVNSDAQAVLKRGYSFVPQGDRLAVIAALRYVDVAVLSEDTDRTVCATLKRLCAEGVVCRDGVRRPPTIFANGGDVTPDAPCPEAAVCSAHGVAVVYGLGDKIQSSSWIIADSVKAAAAASAASK